MHGSVDGHESCMIMGDCQSSSGWYKEKAPNAWHRRGTQNTGNSYNQPIRPSAGTPHRPGTRHYRKGSPGIKTPTTNQHSSRARLQHTNHPRSSPTSSRVIARSSQPTQPAAKHRRAEPHHHTGTTRLSGDTQRPKHRKRTPHADGASGGAGDAHASLRCYSGSACGCRARLAPGGG